MPVRVLWPGWHQEMLTCSYVSHDFASQSNASTNMKSESLNKPMHRVRLCILRGQVVNESRNIVQIRGARLNMRQGFDREGPGLRGNERFFIAQFSGCMLPSVPLISNCWGEKSFRNQPTNPPEIHYNAI